MSLSNDISMQEKLKQGDMAAFERMFKEYYPVMFAVARRYIYDEENCKDLIQDVFTYIWDNRTRLDIHSSLPAYLAASVKHAALNFLKHQRISRDYHEKVLSGMQEGRDESLFLEDGYEAIQLNETATKLHEIISSLPEQCRTIFEMSRYHGIRHKVIARMLNLSPKTIEVQIYRALQILKEKFSEKS